eukprot:349641-Chlamydomonas_euryale.AAC.20
MHPVSGLHTKVPHLYFHQQVEVCSGGRRLPEMTWTTRLVSSSCHQEMTTCNLALGMPLCHAWSCVAEHWSGSLLWPPGNDMDRQSTRLLAPSVTFSGWLARGRWHAQSAGSHAISSVGGGVLLCTSLSVASSSQDHHHRERKVIAVACQGAGSTQERLHRCDSHDVSHTASKCVTKRQGFQIQPRVTAGVLVLGMTPACSCRQAGAMPRPEKSCRSSRS